MTQPRPFRILTCADAGFFHFLPMLERNIYRKTGQYPIIYDLGLTPSQRGRLKSDLYQVTPPSGHDENVPGGAIRAHHKPDCLAHFFANSESDVLYIDADVLMIESLPDDSFAGADIAVTPRHPNEMRSSDPFRNGTLNTGVIYFANRPAVQSLLSDWTAACAAGDQSDQQALSRLLADADLTGPLGLFDMAGLMVLKLDPREFNDVGCRTGRLWHFKNAGRRVHKKRRWWIACLREWLLPAHLAQRAKAARDALPLAKPNRDWISAK